MSYSKVFQALSKLQPTLSKDASFVDLIEVIKNADSSIQSDISDWLGISLSSFQTSLDNTCAPCFPMSETIEMHHITPQDYSKTGSAIAIEYGWHDSPFGMCFIAGSNNRICKLAFFNDETQKEFLLNELRRQWHLSELSLNQDIAKQWIEAIFNHNQQATKPSFKLLLKGTDFQRSVWEVMLGIPKGCFSSYSDLAAQVGKPKAVRAAASATKNNPIGYLVPCHRIVLKSGAINKYRWGIERKQAMLLRERFS